MKHTITIQPGTEILREELEFQFSRSGGPGGQNVNKVESRVQVIFHVGRAGGLTDAQRGMIRHASKSLLGADDTIRFSSQETRSQWKNRELAVEKLVQHLQRVLKPRKRRRPTKTSAGGREKRLERKKRTSSKKKMRRSPVTEE